MTPNGEVSDLARFARRDDAARSHLERGDVADLRAAVADSDRHGPEGARFGVVGAF